MAKSPIRVAVESMLQLVYPQLCEGCSRTLVAQEELLCIECIGNLPFTHFHHIPNNESAMRFAGRIVFERATALAYFSEDGLLQHLLHLLKYKGNLDVARFFGQQLVIALEKEAWFTDIDFIVPVPLFPKKEKQRGFNQCTEVAKTISAISGIPIDINTIQRTRDTESQTLKSRVERVENMKEAFAVFGKEKLCNKHILLLDDVLTTGATIEACIQALQQIENTQISILTIGIAIQ